MKTLIARHRAEVGILALIAVILLHALPEDTADRWGDVAMATLDLLLILVAIAGAWAVLTSPYMSILYREAPLKRAMTGVSDLDERELALRDRANGMTYYLFAAINMLALMIAAALLQLGWIELEGEVLRDVMLPYAYFAIGLPVLVLEWFEPSSLWAAGVDDEPDEEDA
jgi:hypothetical protein